MSNLVVTEFMSLDGIVEDPGGASVFPIILGSGPKLFGRTSAATKLRLVSATPLGPDGVLLLIYRR
jgi:hypothetical protein